MCLLRIVSTLKAKKADTYSCMKRDKKKNFERCSAVTPREDNSTKW